MSFFKLPDLGEGLQEATLVEWHVTPGEIIKIDQPMVSVETAKAIVEIPSPLTGTVKRCLVQAGDCVPVGTVLIEFDQAESIKIDTGTVVGSIQQTNNTVIEDSFIIGSPASVPAPIKNNNPMKEGASGIRRAMAHAMDAAHKNVALVTLHDEADIYAWPKKSDITIQIICALRQACLATPYINAWYDHKTMQSIPQKEIHLGVAVDTEKGLYVPVLHNIAEQSPEQLREILNRLKQDIARNQLALADTQGATITLSNFGTLAGRFATPMVTPPQVAIVGIGKIREQVIAHQGAMKIHPILPISLSFDHRALTGGEAARFLHNFLRSLEENT